MNVKAFTPEPYSRLYFATRGESQGAGVGPVGLGGAAGLAAGVPAAALAGVAGLGESGFVVGGAAGVSAGLVSPEAGVTFAAAEA